MSEKRKNFLKDVATGIFLIVFALVTGWWAFGGFDYISQERRKLEEEKRERVIKQGPSLFLLSKAEERQKLKTQCYQHERDCCKSSCN